MTELTLERFEQLLDTRLQAAEQNIIRQVNQRIDQAQEELARMVEHGFDDVLERLDVQQRMVLVEQKLRRIEEALHLS